MVRVRHRRARPIINRQETHRGYQVPNSLAADQLTFPSEMPSHRPRVESWAPSGTTQRSAVSAPCSSPSNPMCWNRATTADRHQLALLTNGQLLIIRSISARFCLMPIDRTLRQKTSPTIRRPMSARSLTPPLPGALFRLHVAGEDRNQPFHGLPDKRQLASQLFHLSSVALPLASTQLPSMDAICESTAGLETNSCFSPGPSRANPSRLVVA